MRPDWQIAHELCLHGVGGAVSRRELLNRLSLSDLTEWMIYIKHFGTPMRRADANSALERNLFHQAHFKGSAPKIVDLIPPYGKQRTLPTDDEVRERLIAWATRGK